jgi:hypothetical protein
MHTPAISQPAHPGPAECHQDRWQCPAIEYRWSTTFQWHVDSWCIDRRCATANSAPSSPGLSWALFRDPPRDWTEGRPVGLLVALGPSNPCYWGVSAGLSRADTAALPMAGANAAGWTRPLGLRFAIRW